MGLRMAELTRTWNTVRTRQTPSSEDDGVSAVVDHHQHHVAAVTASNTPAYRQPSSNNNNNIITNKELTNNSSIDDHSHRLESSQVEGIWPIEHPLPLPAWQCEVRPVLPLVGLADYEDLVHEIEAHVQRLLEQHNYNTVGNLLKLYEHYQHSGCTNLAEFFQSYSPPITPDHHTCVGLALELWHKLHRITPITFKSPANNNVPISKSHRTLGDYLYLVSCEESIGEFSEYCALFGAVDDTAHVIEKEHVLLACKFELADSGRRGIMLCDPGYHVGRVVTVMMDGYHPHTGTFIQAQESASTKTYTYTTSPYNPDFIEWIERNTRASTGKTEEIHSLLYIRRPYLTAVDVTERRNLVYNFRSLLSRDAKGHVLAGIYFKVKMAGNWDEFTIFYRDQAGMKQRAKWSFSMFKQLERLSDGVLKIISDCNEQLNLAQGELLHTLATLANVLYDRSYIQQMLDINNCINLMTEV